MKNSAFCLPILFLLYMQKTSHTVGHYRDSVVRFLSPSWKAWKVCHQNIILASQCPWQRRANFYMLNWRALLNQTDKILKRTQKVNGIGSYQDSERDCSIRVWVFVFFHEITLHRLLMNAWKYFRILFDLAEVLTLIRAAGVVYDFQYFEDITQQWLK
jgi:hypothetical protein